MENLQKALNLTLEALRTTQYVHIPEIFERHFRNLKVVELDEDGTLIVTAPDHQVNNLNNRFAGTILNWLQNAASLKDVGLTGILFVTAAEYASALQERSVFAAPLPEEVSSVTVDSPEPQEGTPPIRSDSTLSFALSSALKRLKSAHYGMSSPTYEKHFAGVKVGHLDSHGKLYLAAKDQNVNLLNARWAESLLYYLQEDKVDVHEVVFVRASKYAAPDIVTPETTPDATVTSPGEDAPLEVEMVWSGNYDLVVQPERIIAIPRYFLRHVARMGVENAWFYIGFRQAAYQAGLHHGSKNIDIPSRQIARWAGIHPVTFWRRFVKDETWDALKGFVGKVRTGDWVQSNSDGRPHQAPNRYRVSMTIPLTPQDVCALRSYLINLAEDCGIEEAARRALAVPPEELLIPAGDASGNCDPMTVYQLVTSLGGSEKAASDLQAHIIRYQDVVLLTQYFAETWLPRLKPGAAWMIAWMRDSCTPDGRVSATLADIMGLTGVTQKTVREWLLDDSVKQFVFEDPDRKARGTRAQRTFLVRLDEPMIGLGAVAAQKDEHLNIATEGINIANEDVNIATETQLGANATHRNDDSVDSLGAVANEPLGADATHRKTAQNARLGANATHRKGGKDARLGANATHRSDNSVPDWVQMQYVLGANARVLSVNTPESFIKLIKESTTTSLKLINSIKKRRVENFENGNDASPDEHPEGGTQLEVVVGHKKVFSSELDQEPENEEFHERDGIEPDGIAADPDEPTDSGEQLEVVEEQEEPVDPQELFQDILKRSSVSLRIQRQFNGKPFYPFLAWLIYGASVEKITDPVAFAITRYDMGMPGDAGIRDIAFNLDDLLSDLKDYQDRWHMSTNLWRVFGHEKGGRVSLLANILGVEKDDRYESLD